MHSGKSCKHDGILFKDAQAEGKKTAISRKVVFSSQKERIYGIKNGCQKGN